VGSQRFGSTRGANSRCSRSSAVRTNCPAVMRLGADLESKLVAAFAHTLTLAPTLSQ
jgi:hypothetical protein